jgi:hypothetical protein
MTAVIFAGPSLPPDLRPKDPAICWRPPVAQGELYRAALGRPEIIGVVDGYFEVVPTVWHKEILWAMSQGIHVYGSASTGALRAAELAPFGMRGIGRIYEAFRDGVLEDDDEVAVQHGPEELGYKPLTEAMVNIRATLDKAAAEGIFEPLLAAGLTGIAKSLFYKKRCWKEILRLAADRGLPTVSLDNFSRWRLDGQLDQKRIDTLEMLAAIRAHLAASVPPLDVSYIFAQTAAWETARRSATSAMVVSMARVRGDREN